jgi:hypothetical protein
MACIRRQLPLAGHLVAVLLVLFGVLVMPVRGSGFGNCCCGPELAKSVAAERGCCKATMDGDTGEMKPGSESETKTCRHDCKHCMSCDVSGLRIVVEKQPMLTAASGEAWVGVAGEDGELVLASHVAEILRPPRA